MKYLLVKAEFDWADECTFYGMALFTQREWDDFESKAREKVSCFTLYFGTNEEREFSDFDEWLECLEFETLDETQAQILLDTVFSDGCVYGHYQEPEI